MGSILASDTFDTEIDQRTLYQPSMSLTAMEDFPERSGVDVSKLSEELMDITSLLSFCWLPLPSSFSISTDLNLGGSLTDLCHFEVGAAVAVADVVADADKDTVAGASAVTILREVDAGDVAAACCTIFAIITAVAAGLAAL